MSSPYRSRNNVSLPIRAGLIRGKALLTTPLIGRVPSGSSYLPRSHRRHSGWGCLCFPVVIEKPIQSYRPSRGPCRKKACLGKELIRVVFLSPPIPEVGRSGDRFQPRQIESGCFPAARAECECPINGIPIAGLQTGNAGTTNRPQTQHGSQGLTVGVSRIQDDLFGVVFGLSINSVRMSWRQLIERATI